jgi:hypothetical protein
MLQPGRLAPRPNGRNYNTTQEATWPDPAIIERPFSCLRLL